MLIRISHEISHSWFGLVIGALDWTEEWLSEGFATFAEDYIHQRTMEKLSGVKYSLNLPVVSRLSEKSKGTIKVRNSNEYPTIAAPIRGPIPSRLLTTPP